jgi:hypothetical protein
MEAYIYTAEVLQTVKDKLPELGYRGLADLLKLEYGPLRKQISEWRNAGHDIPYTRHADVGEIRPRLDRGVMRDFIKTETGWKRLNTKPRGRIAQPKKRKPKTKMLPARRITPAVVKVKRKDKVYQTRSIDLSKKVPVYIAHLRMTVFVAPGTDRKKVIEKYNNHYEFMNKRYAI